MSALRAAGRHHVQDEAETLQPATIEAAYATIVSAQIKILTAINEQIAQLQAAVSEHFGRHPAAEVYLSQPGLRPVLAARVLSEFGDDTTRFCNSRARKNYSGRSPVTRLSPAMSMGPS
jgi:transposase